VEKSEGVFIENIACVDCDSSDGMALYEQEDGTYDGYCRGAGCSGKERYKSNDRLANSEIAKEYGITVQNRKAKVSKVEGVRTITRRRVNRKKRGKAEPLNQERIDQIFENTSAKGRGYRGISDRWLKYFGIRTEYCEETGEVKHRYYPITKGKTEAGKVKLVGFHRRQVDPKDFRPVGLNSKECELFGQWCAKPGGKRLLITGGQEDAAAAKEMLENYRERKGKEGIAPVDVVCATVGETSCASQVQYEPNYEFVDSYEMIIVDMDEDEAGHEALEKLLEVLPIQKTRILMSPAKDANQALNDGLEQEYVRAFYNAQKPRLAGVVSGEQMWDAMIDAIGRPLIPLPPELRPLQDKLAGGLPWGEIINILAASGVGKTTITNLLLEFWIRYSPYKPGVLSLEAGAGKFMIRLVSGFLKKNIPRLETAVDKIDFLQEHKEEVWELLYDEDGEERFCLVDDQGEIDNLAEAKRTIEKMIRQGGCKLIIIDPIQDLLDSLTIEEQAAFVGWQKKIKARDKVTFINVNHTRKSGGGGKAGSEGGELTEEDMQGTSALYKSGAVNIIISRNKNAEDDEERNTTKVKLTKARDTGDTGPAQELYYDLGTSTLHNKEDYFKENSRW
jgi:hypothetical protein